MTTVAQPIPIHALTAPHAHAPPNMHGRDKLPWSPEVWKRLDAAVHEEMTRARVAARFLPAVHVQGKTLTAPSEIVVTPTGQQKSGSGASEAGALSVDEGDTTRINEFWVEFTLTPAQVEHEAAEESAMAHGHSASTGITLATRAANILSQAEDTLIFQGKAAANAPLFSGAGAMVSGRGKLPDLAALLPDLGGALAGSNPNPIVIPVSPINFSNGQSPSYQGNTVAAVAQAFAQLQSRGQYGPYTLVLQTTPYADAHSPLPSTLIVPAAPIRELVTAGFFGAGTLPSWEDPSAPGTPLVIPPATGPAGPTWTKGGANVPVLYSGILLSLGGNTMDLVRGRLHHDHEVAVTFEQKDVDGNYRFRVVERFALRLKDPNAVAVLAFLATPLRV
jgi:uncharacterized linocin/CFP29 family protein